MTSILQHHSVLYAEDEPDIRNHVVRYLQTYFGTVYSVADGQAAYDVYLKSHPDVAILDVDMPKLDGLGVAKKIRAHDDRIKLIMLTAYTDTDKLLAATELRLSRYLVKPVSPQAFKEALQIVARELTANPSRFYVLREGYVWDKIAGRLTRDDQPVALSVKETALWKLFMEQPSAVVTYESITVACWEDALEREISIDSVKNLVSQLRKKLPPDTIRSIYGKGYVIA